MSCQRASRRCRLECPPARPRAVATEEKGLPPPVCRASKLPRQQSGPFLPAAVASITMGVISVVPYNFVLESDSGSPLFVSFVLHMVIVALHLPQASALIRNRKIPIHYHMAIVVSGCLFTTFKSDAYVRLPASVCMLLSNMRMVVGVVVQYALFRKHYSYSQLGGVLVVTIGISWASISMQQAHSGSRLPGDSGIGSFSIGAAEVLASSVALSLLSIIVKEAYSRYGERVEEQVFIQHLFTLPLAFPGQWDKIGPRFHDWVARRDGWLAFNLLASVLLTFAARSAAARMAGRAPNLLAAQLVQTIECFLQLLVVALLRGWPPGGFWMGALLLVVGTLQYLRASSAPREEQAN